MVVAVMYGVADYCSKTARESDFVGALVSPWPSVAAGQIDLGYLSNRPNLPEDLN